MSTTDESAPAHPCRHDQQITGLTKREWFAGLALQGELASPTLDWSGEVFSKVAENAYKFADAMIEEGKK